MDIEKRMMEMLEPVDKCIQLTDDDSEMLMLACAMMQRVREIFDSQIGIEGRKQMFKELIK
jgi:hypothetical protein